MRIISCAAFLLLVQFLTAQTNTNNYISTKAESSVSLSSGKTFLVFPLTREQPVQWNDSLKTEWLQYDYTRKSFELNAQPGEFFVFQLGIWAIRKNIQNVQVRFSDFTNDKGKKISSSKFTCFTTGGINSTGQSFTKKLDIPAQKIQPAWMGVDLNGVDKDVYSGEVSVSTGAQVQKIRIRLVVKGNTLTDHGDSNGWRLSRLRWLNSKAGIDENVIKGYLPVERKNNSLFILGRSVTIAANGLPAAVESFFDANNERLLQQPSAILHKPMQFVIEKENGETISLKPGKLLFTKQTPAAVHWEVKNTSPECELICRGRMEFDGFLSYELLLKPLKNIQVKNISLQVPVEKSKAKYMMGLHHEGGFRPANYNWQWDTTRNQDAVWIGGVNGGLRLKLKDENYVMPLVNIYYRFGSLRLPASWGNNNKGGVNVNETNYDVTIDAYCGSRLLEKDKPLHFNFELLITPFKTISKEIKYADRYYHGGNDDAFSKINLAKNVGATILNIHHAEDIYPFINYPYLDANVGELKKLTDSAHAKNLRLKLYYTTREITKNFPEFWAFYSLNGEIIYPGPGNNTRTNELHPQGPHEWLIKNVREKYIPAWYNPIKKGKFKGDFDLSVITTPGGRLNNFYIGGLDWMLRNLQIDGLYIDDAALDRFTFQRARKLIDKYRNEGRIDFHVWNPYRQSAGFASGINLYMDMLPYFDLLWPGEGRDYDRLPDHWLVEVSGIPFGLPGQMLKDGGNPWRGMVYGITTRAGWTKNPPNELWKFWDEYKFKEKDLIGYWDANCPVTTNNEWVKASLFKGKEESIIAVANWNKEDEQSDISIDWSKLGYDPSNYELYIPAIPNFQDEAKNVNTSSLQIPGKKGYLIVMRKK